MTDAEREIGLFTEWYVANAFDYERHPLGSRECAMHRKGWQAGYRAALDAVPEAISQRFNNLAKSFEELAVAAGVDGERDRRDVWIRAAQILRRELAAPSPTAGGEDKA